VRKATVVVTLAFIATGCGLGAPVGGPPQPGSAQVLPSGSPFIQVTAGPVHAWVPDGWQTVAAHSVDDLRGGFFASPQPRSWDHMDGTTSGMAATWIDATRVGVPSDFYYLAANGPLMSQLNHSADCRADRHRVFLDNRPNLALGPSNSAGDYMASGEGTCHVKNHNTRWAYFIAAPGFGPVRHIGIPSSGLYVVVAVVRDATGAAATLRRLIAHTSFAGSTVPDFLALARG
jgi:hypothetical protein